MTIFSISSFAENQKPNILLLLADDLGYNDLGAFTNNDKVPTKNLNELAQQGLKLTRFYTESTCAASRVALITGRYPARAGFRPVGRGIPPQWQTLPELLQQHQYTTHHVGKWHMGFHEKSAWPKAQGFDTSFGFLNQWLLSSPINSLAPTYSKPSYRNPWLQDELGNQQQYQGHLTDILTKHTIELIQQKANKPWFIYHAYYAPHRPIQAAERFTKKHPSSPEGLYLALLEQLDDSVRAIIHTLKISGQLENTIIIFASDNGGTNQHKTDNNYPYYGKKNQYYEGGTRTPAFIYWKGKINSSESDSVTHIMDIYPSIASLLNIPTNDQLDGVNIFDQSRSERNIFWETYGADQHIYGVLSKDGNYRYYDYLGYDSFANLQSTPSGEPIFSLFYWLTKNQLKTSYKNWRSLISKVDVEFNQLFENGAGEITTNDFQRSPGLSGFTFGIGITPEKFSNKQTIAYQPDLLNIYLADNKIIVEIEGEVLQSKPISTQQCHTVVLTTHLLRDISILGKKNRENPIVLYVDGEKQDEKISSNSDIPKANLSQPLYIGLSGSSSGSSSDFNGSLMNPTILNVKVHDKAKDNQFPLKDFEQQLCLP